MSPHIRDEVAAVLTASVCDTDVAGAIADCSPSAVGWIPAAAEYHGVTMTLYRQAREQGPAAEAVTAALRAAVFDHVAIQMRIAADLRLLRSVVDPLTSRWVVVKGPVLAEAYYGEGNLRSYSDLDVLIDPVELGALLDVVTSAGATMVDVNWQLVRQSRRGELNLTLPMGTTLDLHWTLINHEPARSTFALSTSTLLDRSIRLHFTGGVDVPTLDPADTLLHLCLHSALSGGYRLGWLLDIRRVAESGAVDWDAFVQRARRTRLDLVAAAMLGRAQRHAGASISPQVMAALDQGRAWLGLLRVLERLRPLDSPYRLPLSGQAVISATRSSTTASLAALAGVVPERLVGRRQTSNSNPLHSARGDVTDRAAYLQAVVADDAAAAIRERLSR